MWQEILQGGGGVSSSFQFSTEEQKTNAKWINGKPLYIKTIKCNALVSGGSNTAHNIDNVDLIFADTSTSFIYNPATKNTMNIPFPNDVQANQTNVSCSPTSVSVWCGTGNYSAWEVYVTIVYTKTTD